MATTTFDTTLINKRDLRRLAHLVQKQAVKADVGLVRQAKAELREAQKAGGGAVEMSSLHQTRRMAHARQVLYFFLRGGINYTVATADVWRLRQAWKELMAACPGLEVPAGLKGYLPAKWLEGSVPSNPRAGEKEGKQEATLPGFPEWQGGIPQKLTQEERRELGEELLQLFEQGMSGELATGTEEIDSANCGTEGGNPIFDHPPGRLIGTAWQGGIYVRQRRA